MSIRHMSFHIVRVVTVSTLLVTAAFSAEPPAASASAPTKQMREQMAAVHEQMAGCLRSEKPIEECRTGMRQKCQEVLGHEGCQTMGMGGMGNMHRMKSQPAQSAPEK